MLAQQFIHTFYDRRYNRNEKESFMNLKSALLTSWVLLFSTVALAQQPAKPANPAPGCKATAAELEANKKAATEFFHSILPLPAEAPSK
jgi:hypothetical protein